MNKNKLIAKIISITMIIGIFTGCSSSVKDKDKTTVTIGVPGGVQQTGTTIQDALKAFEDDNPNIKVEIKEISFAGYPSGLNDYSKEINTLIDSKSAPDLFYVETALMGQLMDKGKLSSLDSYIDKSDILDFEESVLAGCKSDGKLYSLPMQCFTSILIYNKEMLSDVGIANPPSTWEELVSQSKVLDKGELSKGLALQYNASELSLFMLQAGGKMTEGDKITFNSPECVKGAEFYLSLLTLPGIVRRDDRESIVGDKAINQKYAAFCYSNSEVFNYMKYQGAKNLGMAILPVGEKSGNIVQMGGFSINKDAKYKTEAIEVAKFMSSKKLGTSDAKTGTVIPVRKSVQELYLKSHPEMDPVIKMIKATAPVEYNKNTIKIQDALELFLIQAVTSPSNDVKTMLDEAVNSIE